MNPRNLILTAILATTLAPSIRCQVLLHPSGSLRVEGDSTLHKWSSTATAVELSLVLAAGAPAAADEAIKTSKVASAELRVPVAELRSGESGLDKNMRAAMSARKFPDVVYRIQAYELGVAAADGSFKAKTSGELTIAGKSRPVAVDMELRPSPAGLEARGLYALKMSDYGIKPPTLMLGAIKVRDEVAVRFDLLVNPRDPAGKTAPDNATEKEKTP